ncbi:hypothetical protein CAEBREN_18031 [Caenorhabditis brenneri]|uniref:Uncharacterized protein n=1 Tax=Caenorhabditis brenneri TaxID=135651 RepID=G0N588_CAEBE|nr:hypothetical protein CAEBREN_18031 [Caenorhabditis brenneri]
MRKKLVMAVLGFIATLLLNCACLGATTMLVLHNESPLLIVLLITLTLCVTLVVIKSLLHLNTVMAGPLESGPARRLTARDANRRLEEMLPMSTPPISETSTMLSRPDSPTPPISPTPPSSPSPRTHWVHYSRRYDNAYDI